MSSKNLSNTDMEKELLKGKENLFKFKTVFENFPEGIILIDETGTVTEWNSFIAAKTGIPVEMAVGKQLWDLQFSLLSEDWKQMYPLTRLKQIWSNILSSLSKDQIVSKEGQYLSRDGSLVLTEDLIFVIEFGEKKSLGIIQRDLTARRNAEIALKESEKKLKLLNSTKDKIFSIIGHDLRSPFNAITGFSELLKESLKDRDNANSEKYLEAIISSAEHTSWLLNNLLTWARNELGMIPFNPVKISLYKTVKEVMELLESSANLKEIIVINNTPATEMVFADKNLLGTILQNLISNAIKYTERKGSIIIDSKRTSASVEIYVSDSGKGIRQEDVQNLFDPANIHTTKGTEEEGGTGLGLIICKEFVEKHGGLIDVESEYGKGSKFRIYLPDNIND
jgi:PAS domain S-box-containing protein